MPPPRPRPIVIAHRGASGYLPEHTLAAYAVAIWQGADYIEPDLVLTRDGELIARHDNQLDLTTDVASRPEFADRRTTKDIDGQRLAGWFSEDFTLAEIKRLRAIERLPALRPANRRFDGQFEIPTLREILALVRAQEAAVGRRIGLYPETKHPSYFAEQGFDMETTLLELLTEYGYQDQDDPVFIQSFEVSNLRRLRTLTSLPLVQLIADAGRPYDIARANGARSYDEMISPAGLADIARYAAAVGPNKERIAAVNAHGAGTGPDPWVTQAHDAGLAVHAYTFRAENAFLPPALRRGSEPTTWGDVAAEIGAYLAAGVDGVFADHPPLAIGARDAFVGGH